MVDTVLTRTSKVLTDANQLRRSEHQEDQQAFNQLIQSKQALFQEFAGSIGNILKTSRAQAHASLAKATQTNGTEVINQVSAEYGNIITAIVRTIEYNNAAKNPDIAQSINTICDTLFTTLADASTELKLEDRNDLAFFLSITPGLMEIIRNNTVASLLAYENQLLLTIQNLITAANNAQITDDTTIQNIQAQLALILDAIGVHIDDQNKNFSCSQAEKDFIANINLPLQHYFCDLYPTIDLIETKWRKPVLEDKIALLNAEIETLQQAPPIIEGMTYTTKTVDSKGKLSRDESRHVITEDTYDEKDGEPTLAKRFVRGPDIDGQINRAKTTRDQLKTVLKETNEAIATAKTDWDKNTNSGTDRVKCTKAKISLLQNIKKIETTNIEKFGHRSPAAAWLKSGSYLLAGVIGCVFIGIAALGAGIKSYSAGAKGDGFMGGVLSVVNPILHGIQRKTNTQSRMATGIYQVEKEIDKSSQHTPTR